MALRRGGRIFRIGIFGLLVLTLLISPLTPPANVQAAPAAQAGRIAVVGASGAVLYAAPAGEEVQDLPVGSTLSAEGRSADGEWLFVTLRTGDEGWVAVEDVVFFGVDSLPVLDEAGAATPGPAGAGMPAGDEATPAAEEEPMAEATTAATATPRPTNTPRPTSTPTPEPTATPTPEPTATPTATPSPTPEPTATPAPTTSAASSARRPLGGSLAVVGARGAELLDAPDGQAVAELNVGNSISIDGRTEDGAWLRGATSAGAQGWVSADNVIAFKVDELPVIDAAEAMAPDEAEMADDAMAASSATPLAEEEPGGTAMPEEETTAAAQEEATAEPSEELTAQAAEAPAEEATTSSAAPTPRPTPVLEEGDVSGTVELTGSRLNIRSGPGTGFAVVAKAYPDEAFKVIGRNGPATWVEIELPDEGVASGWVSVNFMRLSDPVADLPITSDDAQTPSEPAAAEEIATPAAPEDEATPAPAEEDDGAQQAAPPRSAATGPTGLSGTLVFQTKVSGDIYVYDLDTGNLRFLTKGYEPDVSRDGSKVVFTRYGGDHGVWAINTDGTNERAVFGGRELLTSPKWSPDGNWIVFSRGDGTYQCYDLGFGICVQESQVCPDIFPGCLPSERRTERPNFALARVNADGDEYRDLNVLNSARAPDWNEAGIVYDSSSTIEITEDTPDGETRQVYAERWTDDADWAPNGGLIAFHSRQGPHWEIFTIPPGGADTPRALTRPETTLVDQLPSNVAPAWSPDGRHIAYLSNRTDDEEAGPWRIWVMDADGGNKRPLPIDVPIEFGFGHEQMVSWGG